MPKRSVDIPDSVAKADMGVAFGYGVQTVGAKTLTPTALNFGNDFLTYRLKNKKKPYKSVRARALKVALEIGQIAAENAGQSTFIGLEQLKQALKQLGIRAGDCPF